MERMSNFTIDSSSTLVQVLVVKGHDQKKKKSPKLEKTYNYYKTKGHIKASVSNCRTIIRTHKKSLLRN